MPINLRLATMLGLGICGLCSCECVTGPAHTFEQKASFSPEQLEYNIGDTIWICSSFSCKGLLNSSTGETEDFCGIKEIGFSLYLTLLEHLPQDSLNPTPANDLFDFVSQEGSISKTNSRSSFASFRLDGDQYSLKIGVIPRRSGKYVSGLYGGGTYSLPHSKKCDTGSFGFTPDVQDNHIFLMGDFFGGIEKIAESEKERVYCFIVK